MSKGFRTGKWVAPKSLTFSIIVRAGNKFMGTYCISSGRVKPEDLFHCTELVNDDLIGIVVV